MTITSNEITVALEEYIELTLRSDKLAALEAAGVDNWDGYDFAMELLDECEHEEENS